jgi:tetratricopeptide (TPR) repeat protein
LSVFQTYVADTYYRYGHFDEARARFRTLYESECGKNEAGYFAWSRLLRMSNVSLDLDQSESLVRAAQKKSCARSEEQKLDERDQIEPTLVHIAYARADARFDEAQRAPAGPAKQKSYEMAAALYEQALNLAPNHSDVARAAVSGAWCWHQIGRDDKAIKMLQLFLESKAIKTAPTRYVNEAACRLVDYSSSDPKKLAEAKSIASKLKVTCK